MTMKKKLKPIPEFKNEDEEREFWSKHEIVDYVDTSKPIEIDLSNLKPSTQTVTLRMPQAMVSNCVIRAMPISDSGTCRSPIPEYADH
jgi:hypothetical protein